MAPLVRILLHIVSAVLLTRGIMSNDTADMLTHNPDVQVVTEMALGLAASAVSWGWYAMAKRFGWNT